MEGSGAGDLGKKKAKGLVEKVKEERGGKKNHVTTNHIPVNRRDRDDRGGGGGDLVGGRERPNTIWGGLAKIG